jgi:ribosome-associated protein
MTDYFVIASAETTIQVRAIGQGIDEALVEQGVSYIRREGWDDAHWVLLDYGDAVVHVFRQEEREFYDIERLWGDAPALTVTQIAELATGEA